MGRPTKAGAAAAAPSSTPGVRASGGGALKRLRAGLQAAGVLGVPTASRATKAKQLQAAAARKTVRSKLQELGVQRREGNPFEHKFSRPKHEVLGRSVKGVMGKPGLTRKRSEESRSKTLLVELQNRNRESHVLDRRIGEGDASMSVEEKMLQRLMREKGGRAGSAFQLDEPAMQEEAPLTHRGQHLAGDAFEDVGFARVDGADSDDGDGKIDPVTVAYSHFGGFPEPKDPSGKAKSKAEVMSEIIAKSKMYKRERQLINEENEDLTKEVDADLDDVMRLLGMENKRHKAEDNPNEMPLGTGRAFVGAVSPSDAVPAAKGNAVTSDDSTKLLAAVSSTSMQESVGRHMHPERAQQSGLPKTEQDAAYDQVFRELTYDRRAKPQDRTKTEHELAVERAQKLIAQEKERLERMKVTDSIVPGLESDAESDAEGSTESSEHSSGSGDTSSNDDESSDIDDEERGYEAQLNEMGSDLESDAGDSEGEEGKRERQGQGNRARSAPPEREAASPDKEQGADPEPSSAIPFIFALPEDLRAFRRLMQGQDPAHVPTVLERLHILNAVSLSRANLPKLEALLDIVLQYVEAECVKTNAVPAFLPGLAAQVVEIGRTLQGSSFAFLTARLTSWQEVFSRTFAAPSLFTLWLCRVMGGIFSTSDFKHRVMTPLTLYLAQVLAQSGIQSLQDVLIGLFVAEVLLGFQCESKRLVPEVFAWLARAAGWLASHMAEPCAPSAEACTFGDLFAGGEPEPARLLATLTHVVGLAVRQQQESVCAVELFASLTKALSPLALKPMAGKVEAEGLAAGDKDALTRCLANLHHLAATGALRRRPLQLQRHKAVAIPTYQPKFQDNYTIGKRYDPDRARAAAAKTAYEYKRELKGAVRELRKDAAFIARHQLQEQKERDASYRTKIKGILGMLANDEGQLRKEEKAYKKKPRK